MNYSYLNGFICRENNDTAIPYKFLESQILTQPQLDSSFIHLSCQGSRNHASDATKVSTYMSLKEIRDPGSQPQKHRWFPDSSPTIHSLIRDLKWYSTIRSRVWISIGYPKTALTLAGAKEVHPRKQCPNDLQFRWSNGPNARPTEFVVPCNYEKIDSLHSSISFLWNQFGPVYPPLMFTWWL